MPGFRLPSADARQVDLDDYRGRVNLILVYSGGQEEGAAGTFVRDLIARRRDLDLDRGEVILIVPQTEAGMLIYARRAQLPVTILADENGEAHLAVGATDEQGRPRPAVFVLDRFGVVYAHFLPGGEQPWPEAADILDWLEYIQIQCPE
jgi:peroxiredoxin